MKSTSRSLFLLCLIGLCLLAASSRIACAQNQPIFLKYKVMGVVYAPPGAASNVTYGNTTMVGSTDSISSSFTNVNTTSLGVDVKAYSGDWFGFGAGFDIDAQANASFTEESGTSSSLTIQSTEGNSIATMGPISSSLGVDHDNDIIYIWLNPVISANVTYTGPGGTAVLNWAGLQTNTCDPDPLTGAPSLYQDIKGCDPNQYPYADIVGIPVWCLKNPYNPAQGCAQWLAYTSRSWDNSYWGTDPSTGLPLGPGLTLRDYADILQADPFVAVNGNAVNQCHSSYGPSMDPNEGETYSPPTISYPAAAGAPTGAGAFCTVEPTVQFNVSGGALSSCTVTHAGSGCGTNVNGTFTPGSGITFNIIPGGGIGGVAGTLTSGTMTPTWNANGGLSSCSVATGGSGYLPPTVPVTGSTPASYNPANPTNSPNFDLYYSSTSPIPTGCGGNSSSPEYGRFQPYGTVEYPVPGPNGLPSTYTGTFQYSQTNSNTKTASDTHSVGESLSAALLLGGGCGGGPGFCTTISLSNSNTMTWQNQSSAAKEYQSNDNAGYTIVGPQLSDNYTGPATYNVYLDNIYGTFAFYSDMMPPVTPAYLGNISIDPAATTGTGTNLVNASQSTNQSACSATNNNTTCVPSATSCVPTNAKPCDNFTLSGSTPVPPPPQVWGTPSQWGTSAPWGGLYETPQTQIITLTNTSVYSMTMATPAVTFSDPGFQIVPGEDHCSSQLLQPYQPSNSALTYTLGISPTTILANECQLMVAFEPLPSDIANLPFGLTQPEAISAYIVAAGTVNAPSDQNILVTNYGYITGNAAPSTYSATLIPTPISASMAVAGVPNVVNFLLGGVATQPFLFTNNYPYSVTLSSFALTDSTDFNTVYTTNSNSAYNTAVPNGVTANCTGTTQTIGVGASCAFTLKFIQAMNASFTKISAMGTANNPLVTNPNTTTLAIAGADGAPLPNITVGPTNLMVYGTYMMNCVGNPYNGWPECTNGYGYYPPSGTITISNNTGYTVTLGSGAGECSGVQLINGTSCVLTFTAGNASSGSCTGPVVTGTAGSGLNGSVSSSCPMTGSFGSYSISATTSTGVALAPITASASYNITIVDMDDSQGTLSCSSCSTTQVVVKGSEKSSVVTTAAAPATASLTLSPVPTSSSARVATTEAARRGSSGAPSLRTPARMLPVKPEFVQSTLSVGVGGFTKALNVPAGTAVNDAAAQLAAQLNAAGSPVTAAANGSVVNLTSVATGSAANLPLSAFVIGEYKVTPSSNTLTGGKAGGTTTNYDSGTVQVTTNGVTASAQWGSGSTQESVAAALAASINQVAGAYWSATASGNVVNLTPVSSASTASTQATPAKARTTARRSPRASIQTEATAAKPDASTTPASSSISVSVIDAAGFSTPSFTATTN